MQHQANARQLARVPRIMTTRMMTRALRRIVVLRPLAAMGGQLECPLTYHTKRCLVPRCLAQARLGSPHHSRRSRLVPRAARRAGLETHRRRETCGAVVHRQAGCHRFDGIGAERYCTRQQPFHSRARTPTQTSSCGWVGAASLAFEIPAAGTPSTPSRRGCRGWSTGGRCRHPCPAASAPTCHGRAVRRR